MDRFAECNSIIERERKKQIKVEFDDVRVLQTRKTLKRGVRENWDRIEAELRGEI